MSRKFAPVAPIQVLEGLWAAGEEAFGNYHLLLAHHTVEHKARFEALFEKIAIANHPCTIIMDNSIVELGDAVGPEMVAEAVAAVNQGGYIDVIAVLPDVMGNGVATREAVAASYEEWTEKIDCTGFMVVAQGSSLGDYQMSVDAFTDHEKYPNIEVIGIPRVLTKLIGSRVKPALYAKNQVKDHAIHFLGFSDNITDDIDSVKIIDGAGIDSAVPLRYREVFTEFIDAGVRPADWFETAQIDKLMLGNLELARKLFT